MKTNNWAVLGGIILLGIILFLSTKTGLVSFGKQDDQQTLSNAVPSLIGQQAPDFNLTTLDQNLIYLGGLILIGSAGFDWYSRKRFKDCLICDINPNHHRR